MILDKLRIGMEKAKVINILGEPDDVGGTSRKYKSPSLYKYGNIELHFTPHKNGKLWMVFKEDENLVVSIDTKSYQIWYNEDYIKILISNTLRQVYNYGVTYKKDYSIVSTFVTIKNKYLNDDRIDVLSRALQVLTEQLFNLIKDGGFDSFGEINVEYNQDVTESKMVVKVNAQRN